MKSKLLLILIIFLGIVLGSLLIFLLSDLYMIFSNKIPLSAYFEYTSYKLEYGCLDCFQRMESCRVKDKSTIDYKVIGGEKAEVGKETHFDINGMEICSFVWSYGMADAFGYYYKKAGCPQIEKCKIIFGGS
ncbi:MAG: hypothetical protein AABW86_03175 [Candidatus Micrarchaeota archaeon]